MSLRKFKATAVDKNGQRFTARGEVNVPDSYPPHAEKTPVHSRLWRSGLSAESRDIELDPTD